jgi:hypothetical protein
VERLDILSLVSNPLIYVILAWVVREAYSIQQGSKKRQDEAITALKDDYTKALKENSDRMNHLTIALVKLEGKLEGIDALAVAIPRIERDISVLYERVKTISLVE